VFYYIYAALFCCKELLLGLGSLCLLLRYISTGWMLKQVVNVIAGHIQAEVPKLSKEDPLQPPAWSKRKRADRDSMEALSLAALSGRCKGEGSRGHLKLTAAKYFASSVEAFAGSTDISMSCDATSLGGKNTLATVAMNTTTGICVWAPPQAPLLIIVSPVTL
jgi:hypothetical protein